MTIKSERHKMRWSVKVAIVGTVAAAMLALGASAGWTAEKIRFQMDWVVTGKLAPFFVGLAKGFYHEEGLEVEISRGYGSGRGVSDVLAGVIDYGFVDSITAIVSRSQGNPVKFVSMVYSKAPYTLVSLSKAGIKTPRDLKAKELAAPVGDTNRFIVSALLSANGLNPGDVTWVTTTPAAKIATLFSGKADAIPVYQTDLPSLLQQAKKNSLTVDVMEISKWGVDIYATGILVRDDRIREKRNQVNGLVRAAMRSWAWSIEHPDETITLFKPYAPELTPELMRQEFQIAIELVLTEYTRNHGIGMVAPAKMERTIDFATQYLDLKDRVQAKDMYTNEFLAKLVPKRP